VFLDGGQVSGGADCCDDLSGESGGFAGCHLGDAVAFGGDTIGSLDNRVLKNRVMVNIFFFRFQYSKFLRIYQYL
jgi:hypothetical protein